MNQDKPQATADRSLRTGQASSRLFSLMRAKDPTGVAGTGHVADGVEFPDGAVVVRWRGDHPTTTVHANLTSVEHVAPHAGRTEIRWVKPHGLDSVQDRMKAERVQ